MKSRPSMAQKAPAFEGFETARGGRGRPARAGAGQGGGADGGSAVEVEVARRLLLEPQSIVVRGVLEELRGLLQHVLVLVVALALVVERVVLGGLVAGGRRRPVRSGHTVHAGRLVVPQGLPRRGLDLQLVDLLLRAPAAQSEPRGEPTRLLGLVGLLGLGGPTGAA